MLKIAHSHIARSSRWLRSGITSALSLAALTLLSACAGTGPGKPGAPLALESRERLLLSVAPFDPVVVAELTRGGLDPARVAEDFDSELRYQLALRHQEEALDSAGAEVRLRVDIRHLQPGSGNIGGFAEVRMSAVRKGDSTVSNWEWRPLARENVPAAHEGRHLVRSLTTEMLGHLKAAPRKNNANGMDYPPPLILLK